MMSQITDRTSSAAVLLLLSLLASWLLFSGCGSSGSNGPTGPNGNPNSLRFSYCRVVEVNSEMHLQWLANRPTRGEILYGIISLSGQLSEMQLADSHDVALIGLLYYSRYIYQVTATDSVGDTAVCSGEFTTPARSTLAPQINGLAIDGVTESSARVTWRTDVPATTILYYGASAPADSLTNDSLGYLHAIDLTGLTGSELYHIRPEAVDSAGARGVGRDTTFTTPAQMMIGFSDTTIAVGDTVRLPLYILDAGDVVRNPLVKKIIHAYETDV